MDLKVGDRIRLSGARHEHLQHLIVSVERKESHFGDDYVTVRTPNGGAYMFEPRDLGFEVQVIEHAPEPQPDFEAAVKRHLGKVSDILIERNREYGNSALDPIGVFSQASREEQLRTQIDHKLSRIARGGDPSADTIRDLIGYLTIYLISQETE